MSEQGEGEQPQQEVEQTEEESPAPAAEEAPAETTEGAEAAEGGAEATEGGAEAPAEEEKEPEPEPEPEKEKEPEKLVKVITAEEVAALGAEFEARWKEAEANVEKTKLGKLGKAAFNGMLDCTVPVDVMSLGKTCRDLYSRFGKPRMNLEHMRWNKLKSVYAWEKSVGGPLWNFPEGQTTELDGPADEVVNKVFVEKSERGMQVLDHGAKIPSNSRINKATYEAIVKRALGDRLKANGLPDGAFEISLDEYETDDPSTFKVTHNVLDGKDEKEVLERAIGAIKLQMEIKSLIAELKKSKNLVAEAVLNSQDIKDRTERLKESSGLDVDAAAPLLQLREATKDAQLGIRNTIKELEEKANDAVFAEKIAGGAGEKKQVEYRVNLARRLRIWLEAQQVDISAKVDEVNAKLLESSMNAGEEELAHSTEELAVDGDPEKAPAPEFLTLNRADAVEVLNIVFKAAIEATLGDSGVPTHDTNDDKTKVWWKVTLSMDA